MYKKELKENRIFVNEIRIFVKGNTTFSKKYRLRFLPLKSLSQNTIGICHKVKLKCCVKGSERMEFSIRKSWPSTI